MDRRVLIAQLNIEHYRRKLASERDDAKRRAISDLLAEEEARLATLANSDPSGGLEQLLDMVASQAAELFGGERAGTNRSESEARLALILDQMPFGFGLTDHTGIWILANVLMRRYAPEMIPSRDPKIVHRWQGFDKEGRLLDPSRWPNARALRGETVVPGIDFIYTTDDGRHVATRIAAAPVRYAGGHVAGAVCVVEELEKSKA